MEDKIKELIEEKVKKYEETNKVKITKGSYFKELSILELDGYELDNPNISFNERIEFKIEEN